MSQDHTVTFVFDLDDPLDAKILDVLTPIFERWIRIKAVKAGLASRPDVGRREEFQQEGRDEDARRAAALLEEQTQGSLSPLSPVNREDWNASTTHHLDWDTATSTGKAPETA